MFGKRDYWQPPEEFEKLKKGDCDDFALWTWRQLLSMGYKPRVVFGKHGRFGSGHARVEYVRDGRWFLAEPTLWFLGETLPRLSTTRHRPEFSVAWDGDKLPYYAHQGRKFRPGFLELVPLLWEWVRIWSWFWLRITIRLPLLVWAIPRRLVSHIRPEKTHTPVKLPLSKE